MTSHDVVDRVRKITGKSKVGHGGTLDPFAEGVLIVGVTREGTKQLGDFTKNTEKEYIAEIELGKTTETLDPEGEMQEVNPEKAGNIKIEEILNVLKEFEGKIEQKPPKYSSVRVNGTKAYKLARQGKDFEVPPRQVNIKEIEFIEWNPPKLTIRVLSSSGTYIRSLARDIGEKLETGGYLTRLVRTKVGDYEVKDSITLEELREKDLKF